MGLRHALMLKCDWSHGVILQFYATCTFGIDEFLSWRTHQQTISIFYDQWCEALGMPTRSDALYRIHSLSSEFESMSIEACMGCMMRPANIPPGSNMAMNNSTNFQPHFLQLYQCLLRTLVPKHGDKAMEHSFAIDLMACAKGAFDQMELGHASRPIDVADL